MYSMITQEQERIKDAALVIRSALRATGCSEPVDIIDYGKAIRIGTPAENLTVRFHNGLWVVQEFTPYLQRKMTYASLKECAHDIAMCEPGVLFHEVGQMEQEIDNAIDAEDFRLHEIPL